LSQLRAAAVLENSGMQEEAQLMHICRCGCVTALYAPPSGSV